MHTHRPLSKILAMILAIVLTLGVAPLIALAEDDPSLGESPGLGASGIITAFARRGCTCSRQSPARAT